MDVLERVAGWRGVAVNAGLAVVFAGLLAKEDHDIAVMHGHWAVDFAVGVVVCAAALLRGYGRARAAAVGLTVSVVAELVAWHWDLRGQPGIAATLALLVLVGSAVRALPVRPAVAVAAGGIVVAGGAMNAHPAVAGALGFGWGAAFGVGLWLRYLDARRRAVVETVRRGERLELARELHDAAAHHISGVVLQAQAARIAARRGPESLDDALAGIESVGTEALTSMRRVIGILRDADGTGDPGDAAGLAPGPEPLADLVGRFARREPGGPAVRLHLPGGPPDAAWPAEVATTVNRVVQEALTNVARHAAGAREVTVTLAHDRDTVTVEVTDDAPSAGASRFPYDGGYGLVGMRERVEALGGTLTAGPAPGSGWTVRATLPLAGRS